MSARDRIIALLRTHPDGLDDDVIAEKLGLSRRQQANSRCREPDGRILRQGAVAIPVRGASLPISGLTAWQGLFDHGRLQAGQIVLVHGATVTEDYFTKVMVTTRPSRYTFPSFPRSNTNVVGFSVFGSS